MLEIIPLAFSENAGIASRHAEFGLPAGPAEYRATWQIQRDLHAEVAAGSRPNTLLLLEHEAVYTAGKRTEDHERPRDGAPVVDVDRGGKITWHGPGQLVGYLIARLPEPVDVTGVVRAIERAIMGVCGELGLATETVEGRSGVWVPGEAGGANKVCAIGLRVAKNTTMHGFALNCNNSLAWAANVIPCGITDAGVTSLTRSLGREIAPRDVIDPVAASMRDLAAEKFA
ncbi:MAG: lipoyl(octanoyl) transferase LipB [Microbacteriaceae bacterium]|nr:lipoyl(octanoyl) transferase LipB [Microbacteriaceae bacterium]